MGPRSKSILLWALLLSLGVSHPAGSQTAGAIMVAPTRVTLEAGELAGEVFVINQGSEPITARISLANRHMREDGSFAEATTPNPGELFADPFLVYAPRRVRLEPGQGQTVRILARPPVNQPAAEYRSHLLFRVEPPSLDDADRASASAEGSREMSIQLVPVFGISIPIILRTGPLSATAGIDGLALRMRSDEPPAASFTLHRTGNSSLYGDVRVMFEPSGGSQRLIGESLGLAVYTPLPMRTVSTPLNHLQTDSLPPGRLYVQFVDHHDNSRILAEAQRTIP